MTELGIRLKEARQAKGMSLDDLQTLTKIQKRYLVGIEEGNYQMMPGPFYVRAFIKQYAEAVGLEPEELFVQYKADVPNAFDDDIPEKLSRVQSRKDISGTSSKVFDIIPKVLVILFIVGAAVFAWYFLQKIATDDSNTPIENNSEDTTFEQSESLSKGKDEPEDPLVDDPDEPPLDDEPEVVDPITPTQEIAVVESSGRRTTYELKNADKFELKVLSTGRETWVNIKNGSGKSFFQGSLEVGKVESQTVDFTNEEEAVIVIGYSPSTEIYVNEQKLEFAAPQDQIRQDITIRYVKTGE